MHFISSVQYPHFPRHRPSTKCWEKKKTGEGEGDERRRKKIIVHISCPLKKGPPHVSSNLTKFNSPHPPTPSLSFLSIPKDFLNVERRKKKKKVKSL
jgi:hypothetical protein